MRILILIGAWVFISACSSARKDIYFKSRLPTQESPLFLGEEDDHAWGFDAKHNGDFFVFRPTSNLVENYNLSRNEHEFEGAGLSGFDLSLTYRRRITQVVTKLGLSPAVVELQFNPSQPLGLPAEWFINLNAGYYKMTAYAGKSNECIFGIFCLSSPEEREASASVESQYQTEQSGNSQKMGLQFGHIWSGKHVLNFSLQWMDFTMSASVRKDGQSDLYLRETAYASSVGFGYYYIPRPNNILGLAADFVDLAWRDERLSDTIVGLRGSFAF